MDKSIFTARCDKLNELKNNNKLDGILALDNRGYAYYNDGFPKKNYQLHTLYNLAQFFFPGNSGSTVVSVEGTETITTIQTFGNEDILVARVNKTNT